MQQTTNNFLLNHKATFKPIKKIHLESPLKCFVGSVVVLRCQILPHNNVRQFYTTQSGASKIVLKRVLAAIDYYETFYTYLQLQDNVMCGNKLNFCNTSVRDIGFTVIERSEIYQMLNSHVISMLGEYRELVSRSDNSQLLFNLLRCNCQA